MTPFFVTYWWNDPRIYAYMELNIARRDSNSCNRCMQLVQSDTPLLIVWSCSQCQSIASVDRYGRACTVPCPTALCRSGNVQLRVLAWHCQCRLTSDWPQRCVHAGWCRACPTRPSWCRPAAHWAAYSYSSVQCPVDRLRLAICSCDNDSSSL